MKPYWLDLRERVLADCDVGMPAKQVALDFPTNGERRVNGL
ncbi:hypothetical protein EP7_001887 [Isosphaeraceae bacterium EP7]